MARRVSRRHHRRSDGIPRGSRLGPHVRRRVVAPHRVSRVMTDGAGRAAVRGRAKFPPTAAAARVAGHLERARRTASLRRRRHRRRRVTRVGAGSPPRPPRLRRVAVPRGAPAPRRTRRRRPRRHLATLRSRPHVVRAAVRVERVRVGVHVLRVLGRQRGGAPHVVGRRSRRRSTRTRERAGSVMCCSWPANTRAS